ncbi:hypothetical protein [Alishewanella jeotgali]|uniref:Uncharacterized protein n=1 Tax=Alishewanella jeotgali KCTC 22429 TaxID=1129374 RepID=H3ZIE4_9ALTE|nr:hypothetical protein [Alishewanella jeotgali]EHR39594.1 hypothetical protein AJE_15774 [Alishewanella jeotgali KCTC 22429]
MTAIQLRFQYLNGGTTSPLVLRFDGEPPPPEPDLLPNTIMVLAARYGRAAIQQAQLHARWRSANDLHCRMQIRYSAESPTTLQLTAPWRLPQLEGIQAVQNWQRSPILGQNLQTNWTQLPLQQHARMTNWRVAPINQQHWLANWRRSAIKERIISTSYTYPGIVDQRFDLVWSSGGGSVTRYYRLPYGPRPPSYICTQNYRPPTGKFKMKFFDPATPQAGSVTLRFSNANNPIICDLDIGGGLIPPSPDVPTIDTTKPIRPPRRRSYIMQPELRCYRVSDNQEVNIFSASLSFSRSNWAATISLACGSRGDKDMLFAGGPQLFKLVVNGYEFFGLAEQPTVSHQFGQTAWTVNARSSIAALASPHVAPRSYTNSTAKGVAALISDELAGTGWTLDYQMTAYNVPAGAFSYQNKTKMEAIAQVVSAIGGMVYADGATNTLIVRPRWPVVPWAIAAATPDIAVHDDVILQYNSTPAVNPLYNKVFVRGEQQGVMCGVRRTGTAGDVIAPDVVDALITDNQAARMRGTAELADSGYKDEISIVLPVMATLPPCLPGSLLGVVWQTDSYKATVDSLGIRAERTNDGATTVRQTVGVLRSYE